jgi:hypothetical protein
MLTTCIEQRKKCLTAITPEAVLDSCRSLLQPQTRKPEAEPAMEKTYE